VPKTFSFSHDETAVTTGISFRFDVCSSYAVIGLTKMLVIN